MRVKSKGEVTIDTRNEIYNTDQKQSHFSQDASEMMITKEEDTPTLQGGTNKLIAEESTSNSLSNSEKLEMQEQTSMKDEHKKNEVIEEKSLDEEIAARVMTTIFQQGSVSIKAIAYQLYMTTSQIRGKLKT